MRRSFTRACGAAAARPALPTWIPRDDYTPRQMVEYLDRYIIGQGDAKRAVANAMRSRWRRRQLEEDDAAEVMPRNILMTGPTGCGKTEVARRLSKLVDAPFVKVEATKFTEVGFHGRDVDQIMRDLVEAALKTMRKKMEVELEEKVAQQVEDRLLDALVGKVANAEERDTWLGHLRSGSLDDRDVTVDIPVQPQQKPPPEVTEFIHELQKESQFVRTIRVVGQKPKVERPTLTIEDARKRLTRAEVSKLIDNEDLAARAITWAEQCGIVFIDEIDKIASKGGASAGPDASAEGVQRDLLPLIEGCVTPTKYGDVKSDYVLFVGAGAFSAVKPTDLVAELRGRLPVRVALTALHEPELKRILTEPKFNMVIQNREMLATEEVDLEIDESAIAAIARIAAEVNRTVENIGARRLHTVLEKVLEDINYNAQSFKGQKVRITDKEVEAALSPLLKSQDLYKYVL